MKFPIDRSVVAMLALMLLTAPAIAQDIKKNNIKDTNAEDVQEEAEAEEKAEQPAEIDPSMFIRMHQDKFLKGIPMDIATVDIYVLGTKITIPLNSVSGIRMGEEGGKGTIALKDGEILNGRIELPELKLSVDWGQAIISRASLKSIDRSRDLHWQQKSTPNGVKWFLAPKLISSSNQIPASAPITNNSRVLWNR